MLIAVRAPTPPDPGGTRRDGFTLIELCVVLAVIGLLAALILPAVLASRAAARSADCRSRLKQIGLALHEHLAVRGRFPTGNSATGWGTHIHLLPFLDQQARHDQFDQDMPWHTWQVENGSWYYKTQSPGVYHCPDDVATGDDLTINYVASAGVPWLGLSSGLFPQEPVGRWEGNVDMAPAVRPRDVHDGLSQTVAFTEALAAGADSADPRRALALIGPPGGDKDDPAAWTLYMQECLSAAEPGTEPTTLGGDWLNGTIGYSRLTHSLPPNARSCADGDPSYGVYAPSSDHAGRAVNVLLGDGAVRSLADGVDPALWQAAGTRSGDEVQTPFN